MLPRFQNADEFAVFAGPERYVRELIDHKELDPAEVANLCAVAAQISLTQIIPPELHHLVAPPDSYIRIGQLLLNKRQIVLPKKRVLKLLQPLLDKKLLAPTPLAKPEVKEWFMLLTMDSAILDLKIGHTIQRERFAIQEQVWRTPLHEAVFACSEDCVDMLLKLKPDVNAEDSDGTLPLEAAIVILLRRRVNLALDYRHSHFKQPATSRVMSRIASKLLDAGHTIWRKEYAMTQKDLDFLRSQGASIDERFSQLPIKPSSSDLILLGKVNRNSMNIR